MLEVLIQWHLWIENQLTFQFKFVFKHLINFPIILIEDV